MRSRFTFATRASRVALLAALLAIGGPRAAAAQDSTATPAPPAPAVRTLGRASWLSDRAPLRVGDLLTVVVGEQTNASERTSQIAQGQRSQKGTLEATINGDASVEPTSVAMGLDGQSRDIGSASRTGDLSSVITVRVTSITPAGLLQIEGRKTLTVDGRPQNVSLKGMVRPQDVGPGNRVASNRVADSEILYTGKKITPRTGFFGKLLGMLWP